MAFRVRNNTSYNMRTILTLVETNIKGCKLSSNAVTVLPDDLWFGHRATFQALATAGKIALTETPTRGMYRITNTGSGIIVIGDIAITPGNSKNVSPAEYLEHIGNILRLSNAGDLSYIYATEV